MAPTPPPLATTALAVGTNEISATFAGGSYDMASATSAPITVVVAGPVPSVKAVSPGGGPLGGGAKVTITGTNFTAATKVTFGAMAATYTVVSSTKITASTPAEAAGTVPVRVTTPSGVSAASVADRYTYEAGPTVTSLNPSSGPTAGAQSVTITGTNFTAATKVTFGGTAATYTVVSSRKITASTPPGAAGTVQVRVTTPSGTTVAVSSDKYTYT